MALAAKIVGANVVNSLVSRYPPGGGPVASVDGAPLTELDEKASVMNDGASFRYEEFNMDRRRAKNSVAQKSQPDRRLNNSLLSNSSDSFALAFQAASLGGGAGGVQGVTGSSNQADFDRGIFSYELISAVIHNELPEMGEELSLTL